MSLHLPLWVTSLGGLCPLCCFWPKYKIIAIIIVIIISEWRILILRGFHKIRCFYYFHRNIVSKYFFFRVRGEGVSDIMACTNSIMEVYRNLVYESRYLWIKLAFFCTPMVTYHLLLALIHGQYHMFLIKLQWQHTII